MALFLLLLFKESLVGFFCFLFLFFLLMLSVLAVSMPHPSIFGSYSLCSSQIFTLDVLQLFGFVSKICLTQMIFTCVSLCWEMSVLPCVPGLRPMLLRSTVMFV